jgi:hypothetical protein
MHALSIGRAMIVSLTRYLQVRLLLDHAATQVAEAFATLPGNIGGGASIVYTRPVPLPQRARREP